MAEVFSSPPGGDGAGATDPVSALQIEQGWSVVGSDGGTVGSVLTTSLLVVVSTLDE
jgi:hypothetical protein